MYFIEDTEVFITKATEDLVRNLSEEDKAALLKNPEYADHHFGLGMYIRNHHIHEPGSKAAFCYGRRAVPQNI